MHLKNVRCKQWTEHAKPVLLALSLLGSSQVWCGLRYSPCPTMSFYVLATVTGRIRYIKGKNGHCATTADAGMFHACTLFPVWCLWRLTHVNSLTDTWVVGNAFSRCSPPEGIVQTSGKRCKTTWSCSTRHCAKITATSRRGTGRMTVTCAHERRPRYGHGKSETVLLQSRAETAWKLRVNKPRWSELLTQQRRRAASELNVGQSQ